MQPKTRRLVTEAALDARLAALPTPTDALTPVTADTDTPAGSSVGELVGYLAQADVTVNAVALAKGSIAVFYWDGAAWQVASSGSSTPVAATPPAWATGTTATTGSPEWDRVVVTFSQPIPAGQLQVRYGATDVWRDIAKASATTVLLTGLSGSTAYAAPQFQVINSAGASATVTAQAFTTPAKPIVLTTAAFDSFTGADGTSLSAHNADTGQAWVGSTSTTTLNAGRLAVTAGTVSLPTGSPAREVTCTVTFAAGAGFKVAPWHDGSGATSPVGVVAYVQQNGQVSMTGGTSVIYNASGGTTNYYTPVGYLNLAADTPHTVKVTYDGASKAAMYVNGTKIIEVACAAQTNLYAGVKREGSPAAYVDDFTVKVAS